MQQTNTMPPPYLNKIKFVIFSVIFINFISLFFPGFVNSNSRLYACIAKQMVLDGDWINLMYGGKDWLDKPHFPFWVTALSYKIFGINPFAYVLPGFLFNLIGVYYTYKLALKLYNKNIALFSCLLYLTVLRLVIGTTSVRAEAYLLGEIMPACYYWLLYNKETKLKYLFLSSFLIIPALCGIISVHIYKKEFKKIFSIKYSAAIFLTFIFISPELITLYLQFDLHPEKIIFGHNHVSGIRFFFWDSQFGRIFNFGPIEEGRGYILFFVHTFFWAFLPWCLVFILAIYHKLKNFKFKSETNKLNCIFLFSSFFIPFILFSLTKFQRDYYTDVIFPFASIVCASYLYPLFENNQVIKKLSYFHLTLAFLFTILAFSSFFIIGFKSTSSFLFILPLFLIFYMIYDSRDPLNLKGITYPSLALIIAFTCGQAAIWKSYKSFEPGFIIAQILKNQTQLPVYLYNVDEEASGLYFHIQSPCFWLNDLKEKIKGPYYIVTQKKMSADVIKKIPNAKLVTEISGLQTSSFPSLLRQYKKTSFNTELIIFQSPT